MANQGGELQLYRGKGPFPPAVEEKTVEQQAADKALRDVCCSAKAGLPPNA